MKITVKRTGGYAGLSEEVAAVDTSRLDPAVAKRVEQLTRNLVFSDQPDAAASDEAVGADMFRYEITASDGERQHTLAFSEGSSGAAPLLSLVEDLKQLS
jgi:hypothetical protein